MTAKRSRRGIAICVVATMALMVLAGSALGNPIPGVPVYRQDDALWGGDTLDHSATGQTIADSGCTLTCYAMLFSWKAKQLGLKDKDGKDITYTPKELNELLKNTPNACIKDEDGNFCQFNMAVMRNAIIADSKARDIKAKGIRSKRTWQPGYSDGEGGRIPAVSSGGEAFTSGSWIKKLIDKGMPVVVVVDFLELKDDGKIDKRKEKDHDILVIGYSLVDDKCKYTFIDPADTASDTFEQDPNGQTYYPEYYDFHTFELVPEPATLSLLALGCLTLMSRRRRK